MRIVVPIPTPLAAQTAATPRYKPARRRLSSHNANYDKYYKDEEVTVIEPIDTLISAIDRMGVQMIDSVRSATSAKPSLI